MSVYANENPAFLRSSMNSMFYQTLKTNDFVLVCDGPLTLALDGVISEMLIKHGSILNVIRNNRNEGLGKALNVGLQYCRNELVARMDSDDISFPVRCEQQVRFFEGHRDVALVGGTIEEFVTERWIFTLNTK